jgi:hypothetical protein
MEVRRLVGVFLESDCLVAVTAGCACLRSRQWRHHPAQGLLRRGVHRPVGHTARHLVVNANGDVYAALIRPEHGGDGKKTGDCTHYGQPILAFPGDWAPEAPSFLPR